MPKIVAQDKSVKDSGAPDFLITSLMIGLPFLCALISLSLFNAHSSGVLGVTLMVLLLEGLAFCFFWRRIPSSPMKTFAVGWFGLGMWGYLLACLAGTFGERMMRGVDWNYYIALYGLSIGASSGAVFALLWTVGNKGIARIQSLAMVSAATMLAAGIVFSGSGHFVSSHGSSGGHGEVMSADDATEHTTAHAAAAHQVQKGAHAAAVVAADEEPASHHAPAEAAETHKEEHAAGASHDVHWTYEGQTGPANWGNLKEDWALCETGAEQSPVDIAKSANETKGAIVLAYKPGRGKIVDNGHTIQVAVPKGSKAIINGHTYELKQFHFHSPSEHEMNGMSFPLEVHFVHADSEGNLAVIGAFVEKGTPNKELTKVFRSLPVKQGAEEETLTAINLADILPKNRTVYQYPGSLTTPPCSEGVVWSVMKASISMSAEQISAVRDRFGRTNRPVQPMNERTFGRMDKKVAH